MPKGLRVGSELGGQLPDFTLSDQKGNAVDFHADRGQDSLNAVTAADPNAPRRNTA